MSQFWEITEKNKHMVKQFVIRLSLVFAPDFRSVTKNILDVFTSLPRDDEAST